LYEERNGNDVLIRHFTEQASHTCVMKCSYMLDTLYIILSLFLEWYCLAYVGKCFHFKIR